SRFEGIAKTNLQASRASDTETLQSQIHKAAKKRLSLSELEILHGRLTTIYQKLMKLFPPTWQHHRLMIVSIIVIIQCLQWQMSLTPMDQFGNANSRLDASLLQ